MPILPANGVPLPTSFTEREVTRGEIRSHITSIQSLIDWSKTQQSAFPNCITCNTPTFESVCLDAAMDAVQFFKDLLL